MTLAAIFAVLVTYAPAAFAQADVEKPADPATRQAEEALAESKGHAHETEGLTGEWGGKRHALEEQGFEPFAIYTTEGWGNVNGGLKRGAKWNGLLNTGFEFDPEPLTGWTGGLFHVEGFWNQSNNTGNRFASYAGSTNAVSNLFAADNVRVFTLWARQQMLEGRVVVTGGQMAADDDFMGSEYSALFLNSAFGSMPSQTGTPLAPRMGGNPAFPIYAVAAPGAMVRVEPVTNVYVQGAIYAGNSGPDVSGNHGFDWKTGGGSGEAFFWETGYKHAHVWDLPGTVKVGGTYHTGTFADFSTGTEARSLYSFYSVVDQALVATKEGDPVLGAFWRGGVSPRRNRSQVQDYTDAGLNWFGPIPGREKDVAGIGVSYTGFSRAYTRSTGGAAAAGETALEVTYRAQVTPWFAVQPDVQFLFNPQVNRVSGTRETATVVGLRGEVRF